MFWRNFAVGAAAALGTSVLFAALAALFFFIFKIF